MILDRETLQRRAVKARRTIERALAREGKTDIALLGLPGMGFGPAIGMLFAFQEQLQNRKDRQAEQALAELNLFLQQVLETHEGRQVLLVAAPPQEASGPIGMPSRAAMDKIELAVRGEESTSLFEPTIIGDLVAQGALGSERVRQQKLTPGRLAFAVQVTAKVATVSNYAAVVGSVRLVSAGR